MLLIVTAAGLAWANSSWANGYVALLHHDITIGPTAAVHLSLNVHEWINDGLMAVFFFLVGLEIKREMLIGELASVRRAALPIAGALGGMLVPAVLYALINGSGAGARGWGIPMATDIAFALGVVALLGSRVPSTLKLFLAAVAIVDDIGAVLVIAIFYTASIMRSALVAASVILMLLTVLNLAGVRRAIPYLVLGVALWVAILLSGIHATVAGVLLAMTIPARARDPNVEPLLERMERALHAPVAFVIVPLFALANAGISIGSIESGAFSLPVMMGVMLGLVIGKPLGITVASWLAVRTRLATLPEGVTWRSLNGVSWLGGIGFTMSLFVGALAFTDEALLDSAKVGVLISSALAASAGWLMLRRGSALAPPLGDAPSV